RTPSSAAPYPLSLHDALPISHLASAAAVGAEPVAVAFEEVYLSLQQGLVDGQENPISLTAENSLDEVVDYLSLSRHAVGSQLVIDRKSTRLNSSHVSISYAVF